MNLKWWRRSPRGRSAAPQSAKQGSNCAKTFNRFLNVHEYQGAKQMAGFGINVPPGIPAFTVQEAVDAAKKMDGGSGEVRRHSLSLSLSLSRGRPVVVPRPTPVLPFSRILTHADASAARLPARFSRRAQVVVKSQILAGGRGLGTFKSGLREASTSARRRSPGLASEMLGELW